MSTVLPSIPAKRYFTIGEVAELCGVKPHVLRYWEQEFTQLRPMKRRGNRRYYQHHEVLMVRRIRDLLYDQGFTISGARNRLQELAHSAKGGALDDADAMDPSSDVDGLDGADNDAADSATAAAAGANSEPTESTQGQITPMSLKAIRKELLEIRALLVWA